MFWKDAGYILSKSEDLCEAEYKNNGLIYMAEQMSRQQNTPAVD